MRRSTAGMARVLSISSRRELRNNSRVCPPLALGSASVESNTRDRILGVDNAGCCWTVSPTIYSFR